MLMLTEAGAKSLDANNLISIGYCNQGAATFLSLIAPPAKNIFLLKKRLNINALRILR